MVRFALQKRVETAHRVGEPAYLAETLGERFKNERRLIGMTLEGGAERILHAGDVAALNAQQRHFQRVRRADAVQPLILLQLALGLVQVIVASGGLGGEQVQFGVVRPRAQAAKCSRAAAKS